jgi:hypothetical protein
MKYIYIQPLTKKYQLEIESLLIEASDQGDHAESKPQILFEDEDSDDNTDWLNID